jgi:hypothetical protein
LRHLLVWEALLRGAEGHRQADLEVTGPPLALSFDGQGNWLSPIPD